eukprot:gene6409-7435_t
MTHDKGGGGIEREKMRERVATRLDSLNDNYFSADSAAISKPGKDFVVRNRSFTGASELKAFAMDPQMLPDKLDIGAVYTSEPAKMNLVIDYRPVARDLVFDIDINDYDDIRVCCKGANLCTKCWRFLAVAAQFLEHQLRACFGFKHLLYVFSGGRGLHVWVSDLSAVSLTKEMRSSLVSFFRPDANDIHPSLLQQFKLFVNALQTASNSKKDTDMF